MSAVTSLRSTCLAGIQNGLKDAITVLDGVEGIRIVSLNDSDIVRNSLVARIVKAYENAKQGEL